MALAVPVVKLRAITHLARRARPPAPHAALPALLDRGADHPVDPPRCPACVPVDALSVGDGGPVVRAWRGAAAVPVGVAAGDGAGRRDVGALPSPTHRHPLMRPPVLRPRHARVRSCSSSWDWRSRRGTGERGGSVHRPLADASAPRAVRHGALRYVLRRAFMLPALRPARNAGHEQDDEEQHAADHAGRSSQDVGPAATGPPQPAPEE
jgi:hypothetical protein